MSHKLTHLKLDNESTLGGKGKSTKKRKVKTGAMTKKELKKFFGHSFPPMPKVVQSMIQEKLQAPFEPRIKRKRQPKYRQDVVLYKVKS